MKPTLRAEIEEIVASIYYKGIHDGIDITGGNKDRFYGNKSARRDYENEFIVKKTQELAQAEARGAEKERDWWAGNLRLYNGEGVHAKDRVLESIVVERKSLSNQQEKEL